jgi:dual specificity protein phosphatase-like protein
MRQVPGYPLWLGHAGDARDLPSLLSAGVRAVVDVAQNEPPAALTRELVYCRFPLTDGGGNPPWLLRAAVDTVASLIRSGTPVLVACGAGRCRAPTIAAAAIAQVRACSLADAIAIIEQAGPLDLSPGLSAEVQKVLER